MTYHNDRILRGGRSSADAGSTAFGSTFGTSGSTVPLMASQGVTVSRIQLVDSSPTNSTAWTIFRYSQGGGTFSTLALMVGTTLSDIGVFDVNIPNVSSFDFIQATTEVAVIVLGG